MMQKLEYWWNGLPGGLRALLMLLGIVAITAGLVLLVKWGVSMEPEWAGMAVIFIPVLFVLWYVLYTAL